jgi:hypothetical protein
MSIYFNQTNIAPGTPVINSTFPQNPLVASVKFLPSTTNPDDSDTIASGFNPYNAYNQVAVFNSVTGNLGPLQVGGALEVQEGGNGPSSVLSRTLYEALGFSFIQPGTGTTVPLMMVNRATNESVQFNNLSTIVAPGASQIINLIALTSTLAVAFPGCVQ